MTLFDSLLIVERLAGRKPCEECRDLPDLTDFMRARSFSIVLTGTPPPRPRGAAVCLPLATNLSSSLGTTAAILVAIFAPVLDSFPLDDVSPEQTDAPDVVVEGFLLHPATGEVTVDRSTEGECFELNRSA